MLDVPVALMHRSGQAANKMQATVHVPQCMCCADKKQATTVFQREAQNWKEKGERDARGQLGEREG